MKHYQDIKTGKIYAFEDNINPFKLNNRNLPIKTLSEIVKEKPNDNYFWSEGAWVHKDKLLCDYKEPVSDVPSFNPAWVSFLFPVGTIIVDDNINIDINLDQINSNTYNWKEFSKIILSLPDINDNELPILLTVDGAIMIPNCKEYYSQEIAINEMNKVRVCFFLAGLLVPLIDVNSIEQGIVEEGGGFSSIYKPSFRNRIRLGGTSISERIVLSDLNRINIEKIKKLYFLGKAYKKIFHFEIDFLVNGYFELINYNLVSALNNLWITVEQLTKKIWQKQPLDIMKDIAKSLKKEKQIKWIAVKHEILNIHNILSDELFETFNDARDKRNDLLHDSKLPNIEIVEHLWIGILELINIAYGIELNELYQKTVNLRNDNKKHFIRNNTFYKNETVKRNRNFDDWKSNI